VQRGINALPGLQITALQSILNPCLILLCFLQYFGVHIFLLRRISNHVKKERKTIYQRCSHHNIGHGEHHHAAENHDKHHGILEHQHDAEGLMWNEVVVPLPRDEFDGIGKLDG